MTTRVGDIVEGTKGVIARVTRIDNDKALLRRYGGDRRPIGYEPLTRLRLTSLVTFLLGDQDLARLREVRRLTFAANAASKDGWGITEKALGAHLREGLRIFADNYQPDLAEETLHDARSIPSVKRKAFQVRLPLSTRKLLLDAADDMRRSLDDIASIAILQQLEICYVGGVLREDMATALRLCVYPSRAEKWAQDAMSLDDVQPESEERVPPADRRVSVDVLTEAIAERNEQTNPPATTAPWAEDGDGIRSAMSAVVTAPPEKPKIRPEDILAMRPLKPPGRT